jgi:ubiquinone/menaquinone biosynthesis C-methylase UbiE
MQLNSYEITYKNEITYWWFKARLKIFKTLYRNLIYKPSNKSNSKILNVGCGTGIITNKFSEYGNVISLDYSEEALKFCKIRKIDSLIRSDAMSLPFKKNSFDSALYFDIIEHLENDRGALEELNRTLCDGGYTVISVPAYKFLWSSFDDINWHKRRYSKKNLQKLLINSGFQIVKISYINFFLFPAAVLRRLYEKIFKRKQVDYYIPKVGRFTNFLFYKIFSIESYLLRFLKFPWGVSLIAVVKKNNSD